MNRDALLLYLRDLRDLEIAKKKIEIIMNTEKRKYLVNLGNLKNPKLIKVPKKERIFDGADLVLLIGDLISIISLPLILLVAFQCKFEGFIKWLIIILEIIFLMGLYSVLSVNISDSRKNKAEITNAKKNNYAEKQRVAKNKDKIEKLQQNWKQRSNFLKNEHKKVSLLLKNYYDLNILANPYRNLASVYYIYDYMSSSQETLKDTLIHEHMENGIERILEKIDYIIDQNQEIIFQNRILEAHNKEIIGQNKKMLYKLKEIEDNANVVAQYAEITANYSEATAYFALASYLKD